MLSLVNVRMIDGICVELKNATSKWFSKTNVWSEGWPVFLELDGGDPYLYEPRVSLDVSDAVSHIRFRKLKKTLLDPDPVIFLAARILFSFGLDPDPDNPIPGLQPTSSSCH